MLATCTEPFSWAIDENGNFFWPGWLSPSGDFFSDQDVYLAFMWYFASYSLGNERAKSQLDKIIALGQLSPNMQLHAKIDSNEYILEKQYEYYIFLKKPIFILRLCFPLRGC